MRAVLAARVRQYRARAEQDVVLVDPWIDLRVAGIEVQAERQRLVDELRAEVTKGHPLFGLEVTTVGRSGAKDDVLFRVSDGRWALVHLTWSRPDTPPWPSTTFHTTVEEVEAEIAARD